MREIALFSTYNKDGIASLARAFSDQGVEIVATGNTRKCLEEEGLKVIDISELTGEPERFGGRVKTLNHKVLGALLFRPGQDENEWPYDFRIKAVVCNFYPFAEKGAPCESLNDMIEWIDIGGPTMVRAAAKNFKHVYVFTQPGQYARYIGAADFEHEALRERLALEAFECVSKLDQEIVAHFQWKSKSPHVGGFLRYGENSQQWATFKADLTKGSQFYGDLSFNNIRDAEGALRFVRAFAKPAVAVVKHQTLCGAATALDEKAHVDDLFRFAWEGDPISRFGGILAFNFVPSQKILEQLSKNFIEVLVLPRDQALQTWIEETVAKKPRLKVLQVDFARLGALKDHSEKFVSALGELQQSSDYLAEANDWESFAQWCAACTKSNAIVLTGKQNELGLAYLAGAGQGQPNRVDALKLLALPRAKDFCQRMELDFTALTCVSDAFLPFSDTVEVLAEAGLKNLLQPGGSKKDEEVSARAKELGVEMKMTGRRHFWH